MSAQGTDAAAARAALQAIVEQARVVARAGGVDDDLGLRNRALEIAGQAQTMLWTVDPDAADWTIGLSAEAHAEEAA